MEGATARSPALQGAQRCSSPSAAAVPTLHVCKGAREQRALLQGAQRCEGPSAARSPALRGAQRCKEPSGAEAVKQSTSFLVRHSCKTLDVADHTTVVKCSIILE